MGLVNKGVKVTVRTGKSVIQAGETLVSTTTKSATNILVNRTSDIYDKHENLTDGLGNNIVGNSAMLARTGYRVLRSSSRSTKNIYKRKRVRTAYAKEEFIKKRGQEKWDSLSEAEKQEKSRSEFINSAGTQEWNALNKHAKSKVVKKNENWNNRPRKEKWDIYKSNGIKKGLGANSTKQSLQRSKKAIVSNQSRKMLSTLSNKEDMGAKVVGTSARTVRGTRKLWKNRKRISQTAIKIVSITKTAIIGIMSFVTSIPAMIGTIISSLPLLIIMIIIIIFACVFGEDLEFSGRVSTFSEGEIQLENDYQTSLNPEEILAISSALGWTSQDMEDYEALLGLVFDGKRNSQADMNFETMMDNVFNKHNPAVTLKPNSPISNYESTGKYYFTSEGFWKRVEKVNMNNEQWLNCYPAYKKASVSEKKNMGTQAYIDEMKAKCRNALEVNGYNYLATFLTIDNPPNIFTSRILPENSGAHVSSPMGYRSITLTDNDGKSFVNNDFHYGTDISVAGGTPVYSPANMTVIYADGSQTINGSYCGLWGAGNVVVLKKEMYDRKGELCYLYVAFFHMQHNSVLVHKGQKVKSGEQVGSVGTTGTSTGNHLHFQTWVSVKNFNGRPDWNYISPREATDSKRGENYSVDDHDYKCIYLESMMFYDEEYRNKLFR